MPLGSGYIDSQGVYRYGEADERPLGSDLLNLLAESVSDTVGDVRDAIQVLADLTTPQEIAPGAVAPGFTVGTNNLITKVGRLVHVQFHVTKSSAILAGQGIYWLPAPYGSKQSRPLVSWYGSGQVGHLILSPAGQLQTDATLPVAGATVLYGAFTYVAAS